MPGFGERWTHKATGITVKILHGGTQVRWRNENGGVGKDSIESFLERFKPQQTDDDNGWRDYDHGLRDGYQAALREGPDALLQAARWVVENWDREATQHASMAALRQAVQRSVGDYQAPVIDDPDAR